MAWRRTLLLAVLCLAGAAEAKAFECDWCCLPGTTKTYGCTGYRMASTCCNGQRQYVYYNVGATEGQCYGSPGDSWAGNPSVSRFSLFGRHRTSVR